MRHRLLCLFLFLLGGCTAFSSVRSAEVKPGRSVDVGFTYATPPGDAAAWFWTWDCASLCDRRIPALDVSVTKGIVPEGSDRAYEISGGLSGIYPYAQGYMQVRRGRRPFGLGARFAGSPAGWYEYAVFARHDVELGRDARLLLSPTLFRHAGNSPNGANPGSFTALAQGIGVQLGAGGTTVTPSVLAVWGRVDRSSYRVPTRDVTAFLVMGVSVGLGGG